MPGDDVVQVVFVDAATGQDIARSELPVDRVPQHFDARATVQIGESAWIVERAERREDRVLALTLRRDILYSLPTICDVLPFIEDVDTAGRLELHEDDWRQVELVDACLSDVVDAQLQAVRSVWEGHRAGPGFSAIHVRTEPVDPLPSGVSKRHLLDALSAVEDGRPVGFHGTAGVVAGSFTVTSGPLTLYGVAHGDTVKVLGLLDFAEPPRELLEAFGLLLVDWPNGRRT